MSSASIPDHMQTHEQPLVWLFVLHYQDAECTRICLDSLKKLDYPNIKVLLLDNGSPDRSGDAISVDFPEFDYVRSDTNLGFAGGCNTGVRYCIERGARWIWLLNNDTKVDPQSLNKLMIEALRSPRAAALGAMVYTPHEGGHVPSGGGEIDFVRGKTSMRRQPVGGEQTLSCEWLSGCNLLLRADAFEQVGGFDEKYFLYFEDTDLCYRLRQSGWDCLLVPNARVEHVGGASTEGKLSTWRMYYYTRNRLLFFLTHVKGPRSWPVIFAIAAHLARHSISLPLRGERGRRQLKAEMLGLRDYVQNRLGKAECLDW